MTSWTISVGRLPSIIQKLSEKFEIYYPLSRNGITSYKRFEGEEIDSFLLFEALEKIRSIEPLKHFFILPRERVGGFGTTFKKEQRERMIIGVKNCDVRSITEVQDVVYLTGSYPDPFYKKRKEKTILVSVDCPEPKEHCFCNIMGGKPFTLTMADINISFAKDSYILDIMTDRGISIFKSIKEFAESSSEKEIKERDERRINAQLILKKINPKPLSRNFAQKVQKNFAIKFWMEVMEGCVNCGACERICPTCHCFLLYDVPFGKESFERVRIQDYCYYPSYGRMGSGANPLREFYKRFRNRFECKFYSFFSNHKVYACTGCGRCIDACTGKLDIRKILFKL